MELSNNSKITNEPPTQITPLCSLAQENDFGRSTAIIFIRTLCENEFKPFAENSESIRIFYMRFKNGVNFIK